MDSSSATPGRSTRLVLLGASNLTRGFAQALAAADRQIGQPLQVYVALGHGRSYGQSSRFAFRTLPGILPSGLWKSLQSAPAGPTYALITDIGNDLVYGVPPQTITQWIATCLDQLLSLGAHVILTGLPLHSLHRAPAWSLSLHQRIAFPLSRTPTCQLIPRANILNESLEKLATEKKIFWAQPQPDWYGLDPIHIRRARRSVAWQHIFAAWPSANAAHDRRAPHAWPSNLRLWCLRPEKRWLFRCEIHRAQPQWRGAGGASIALF